LKVGKAKRLMMSDQSPVFELRVALTVDDYDQAFAFWHEALGLPVSASWGEGDGRGAVLAAGRARIEILSTAQGESVDRIEVGRKVGAPIRLALEVADSAGVANRLEAAGAEQLGNVVETPWGHHNVRLKSPDGLQLTLFTVLDGTAHRAK
jgi:catechol 2,3-dioxygenase-like lactoylglutathione lyase family enzyme